MSDYQSQLKDKLQKLEDEVGNGEGFEAAYAEYQNLSASHQAERAARQRRFYKLQGIVQYSVGTAVVLAALFIFLVYAHKI